MDSQGYLPRLSASYRLFVRNTDISGIKLSNDETEETENQILGDISCLLVWPFSLAGGWNPEVPDIGGLRRVVRSCGGRIAIFGHPTHYSRLQINKRRMMQLFMSFMRLTYVILPTYLIIQVEQYTNEINMRLVERQQE